MVAEAILVTNKEKENLSGAVSRVTLVETEGFAIIVRDCRNFNPFVTEERANELIVEGSMLSAVFLDREDKAIYLVTDLNYMYIFISDIKEERGEIIQSFTVHFQK